VTLWLKPIGSTAATVTDITNMSQSTVTNISGDLVVRNVLCSNMVTFRYQDGEVFGIVPHFIRLDGLEGMLISQIRGLIGGGVYKVSSESTDCNPKEFLVDGNIEVHGLSHKDPQKLRDLEEPERRLVGSVNVRFHNVTVSRLSRFNFDLYVIKYDFFNTQLASDIYSLR
jgi:hypothetical protein